MHTSQCWDKRPQRVVCYSRWPPSPRIKLEFIAWRFYMQCPTLRRHSSRPFTYSTCRWSRTMPALRWARSGDSWRSGRQDRLLKPGQRVERQHVKHVVTWPAWLTHEGKGEGGGTFLYSPQWLSCLHVTSSPPPPPPPTPPTNRSALNDAVGVVWLCVYAAWYSGPSRCKVGGLAKCSV